MASNEDELNKLFKEYDSIVKPFMEEMRRTSGFMRPPTFSEKPELKALSEKIEAIQERIRKNKNQGMNLAAADENQYLYGDDWVPPPSEDVQMFGEPMKKAPKDVNRPRRGTISKSGLQVETTGDFIKNFLENPGGLNLGFGEGARVTQYSQSDPTMPTRAEGRYAFRATSGKTNVNEVLEAASRGVNVPARAFDPALEDFARRGLVTSNMNYGSGSYMANPQDRSFWSLGSVDPTYIDGAPGNVFVMDTQRARYLENRTVDPEGFEDWRLSNPQYTTFQPDIPADASRLQRAMFAANPMNRTGLAIIPQVTDSKVPSGSYMGQRSSFVTSGRQNAEFDIGTALTVNLADAGQLSAGGMNQYGQRIDTPVNRLLALQEQTGTSFGKPVYDRVTPFFQRPWETHMANIGMEANIARSTIPELGKAMGESAIATTRAVGPVRTLGIAGVATDVVFERAQNMSRYPDPISGWMNAAGETAMNMFDPTWHMGGVVGGLEAVGLGSEARRTPIALRGNMAASNAEYERLLARQKSGYREEQKTTYPFGINPDGASSRKW